MIRCLFYQSNVLQDYWPEVVETSIFLINKLPTPILNGLTPHQALLGKKPEYSMLSSFGCRCYHLINARFRNKFDPKSVESIFLGYFVQHKGYGCLDPKTNKIYLSRNDKFDETSFPFIETPKLIDSTKQIRR